MSAASSDQGRLLDHIRIIRDEAVEMMMIYLGDDPEDALYELEVTQKR